MTPRQLALKALLWIRDEGPGDQSCGICTNVEEKIDDMTYAMDLSWKQSEGAYRIVKNAMREWPKYSGDPSYPIKPEDTDPEMAYDDAKKYGGMWEKYTVYGDLRWELVNWLIETLSKEEA